jgi:hypothetical protein
VVVKYTVIYVIYVVVSAMAEAADRAGELHDHGRRWPTSLRRRELALPPELKSLTAWPMLATRLPLACAAPSSKVPRDTVYGCLEQPPLQQRRSPRGAALPVVGLAARAASIV